MLSIFSLQIKSCKEIPKSEKIPFIFWELPGTPIHLHISLRTWLTPVSMDTSRNPDTVLNTT